MVEMEKSNEKKQKECLISIRDLHKSYGAKTF